MNELEESGSVMCLIDTSKGKVQGGLTFGGTGNRDATSGFSFVTGESAYRLFSITTLLQPTDAKALTDEYPAFELKVFLRSDKQNTIAVSQDCMQPDWHDAQLVSRVFYPVEFFFPKELILQPKTEYIVFPDPMEGTGWYRFAGTQTPPVTAEGYIATAGTWWRYLNTVDNPPYAVFKSGLYAYRHLYTVNGIKM